MIDVRDIPVDAILVGARRRGLRNVADLAESISQVGLLNPISVTANNGHFQLVTGWHRLEACRSLGWSAIPAVVNQDDDLLAALREIDENLKRSDLTALEQGEHLVARSEILEGLGLRAKIGQGRPATNGEESSPFLTTAAIAKEVGLDQRLAQQRMQVARNLADDVKDAIRDTPLADEKTELLTLARMDESEQREVVRKLAEGEAKTVKQAAIMMRNDTLQPSAFPTGTCAVLYADPPWSYNNSGFTQSAASQYPTMSTTEIAALPVANLCTDETVLFLWATSPLLPDALAVMAAWGFEYKASMVWDKGRAPGIGWFVQTRHELLLIGTRGGNPHPRIKPESVIAAEPGRHSEKPSCFYGIIESMYGGPYCELFARTARDGWTGWGNEYKGLETRA